MTKFTMFAALIAGLAFGLSGEASAAPVGTDCGVLGKFKAKTDTPAGNVTTTSTTFVDVLGTNMSFTAGGSTNSCALVTLSGRMLAVGTHELYMQVLMDGATVAAPGEVVMATNDHDGSFFARSYTWVFPSVAPGAHTLKVQFRSSDGTIVYLYQHAMVVQYR